MSKKNILFQIIFLIGFLCITQSCTKDTIETPTEQETEGWHCTKINFNISVAAFEGEGSTRATTEQWQDGDIIYFLLTDIDGDKVRAYVKYDGISNDWGDVMFEGKKSFLTCTTPRTAEAYFIEGAKDLSSQTITINSSSAIYTCTNGTYVYPADGSMTVTVTLRPYTGRIRFEGKNETTATISGIKTFTEFSFLTGEFTESTSPVKTTVAYDGTTPYIYGLFIDPDNPSLIVDTDKSYRTTFDPTATILKSGHSGFMELPTSESMRGWSPYKHVTNMSISNSSATDVQKILISKGKSVMLTAVVSPSDADQKVVWTSSNTAVVTVDSNGKVTALNYGTTTITATSVLEFNRSTTCEIVVCDEEAGHEYVDLELSSGTLWATCNIGATNPEYYGVIFAWGDTIAQKYYDSSTYKYPNPPATLPLKRDAANCAWKGKWRMPTQAEINELCSECSYTYTTQNGKQGVIFVSNKNRKSIFMPQGIYWSSSLMPSSTTMAYALYLTSDKNIHVDSRSCSSTGPIRPVFNK